MDPIDYSGAFANVQSPIQAFSQGLQGGAMLQQVQAEQAQQQAAIAQKQQMQADLAALSANPTPQAIAQASLKYPQLSEQFKRSLDMLTPEQQKAKIAAAAPVHAAALAGKYDVAAKQLREHADALQNSGNDQEAQQTRAMADLVEQHPETATVTTGMLLASAMGPDKYATSFKDIGAETRATAEAPAELAKKQAEAASAASGVVGQTLGSLQGKNAKPEQAYNAIGSLQARGLLSADDAKSLRDSVPTDPKALDTWFGQQRAAGMKTDDQQKYLTPDANTVANNKRIAAEGAANRAKDIKVQDMINDRQDGGDDAASFTPEAIDNAAARYNIDGTLPPMGMGKAAAAGRTKILNRAAELKAGISGEQQRRDQLTNKGDIASQNKAVREFASGKLGSSVRSFNVGLSHLDTLGQLADAMGNKDTQAVNRLGNYFATQTGAEAPVKFEAAKKVVTDEIVKAIVGAGGTGHDREEAAKTVSAASSPAQLRGVIDTYKELMVGQLGGLDQQYRTSTGRDDFHKYLSPQAQALYGKHGGAPAATPPVAAAPAIPTGWSVREH